MPVKSQKLELHAAGLGRKKVVFGNKDEAIEVSKKLDVEVDETPKISRLLIRQSRAPLIRLTISSSIPYK